MGVKDNEPGNPMASMALENSKDTQQRRRELGDTLGKKLSGLIIATKDSNVRSKLLPSTTANLLGMDIHNREVWELLIPDGEELARVFALLDEYESIHVVGAPRVREFIPSRQDSPRQDPSENDSGMNARLISDDEIEEAREALHRVPDKVPSVEGVADVQSADTITQPSATLGKQGSGGILGKLKNLFGFKK